MYLDKFVHSSTGKTMMSILLGLGLATLFRKACEGKSCINFNGPLISEIDGKTYKYGEYCYKYKLSAAKCDSTRKTVELASKKDFPIETQ